MAVSDPTTANIPNSNVRQRLGRVFAAVRDLVRPRRIITPEQAAERAQAAAAATMARGMGRRSLGAEASAPETEGAGLRNYVGPEAYRDRGQQGLLGRRQTRYERYAGHAGYGPVGWHLYQSLTLDRIAYLHDQVDRHGILLEKDDTDRYVLRKDPPALAADRQRRSKAYRAPLLVKPRDRSPAAATIANFIRAAFDDFDRVDLCSNMLSANLGGSSCQELIYRTPRPVPVVTGKGSTAIIQAETIDETQPVYNRYLKYNVATDKPWIDMGMNRTVDPEVDPDTGEPSRKFLFHSTFGDGHSRQRGYGFALHYLHSFEQLGWEAWITVLETYGRPVPYLQMVVDKFADDDDRNDAIAALENHGTGKPAIIHDRWGTLKHAPIPSGVDGGGIHAAIIGALRQQKLILIQGETLSVELGGTGSYKAGEVHENSQENVQWIDCVRSAQTLRKLARFLVEINRDELARITGLPPAAVVELTPRIEWFLDRQVDPVQRLAMFKTLIVDLKMAVDPNQIYDEFHILPPGDGEPAPPDAAAPAGELDESEDDDELPEPDGEAPDETEAA